MKKPRLDLAEVLRRTLEEYKARLRCSGQSDKAASIIDIPSNQIKSLAAVLVNSINEILELTND